MAMYKLKFEEMDESASPAYITREAETKIMRFNPSEKLRHINQTRGKFALNAMK